MTRVVLACCLLLLGPSGKVHISVRNERQAMDSPDVFFLEGTDSRGSFTSTITVEHRGREIWVTRRVRYPDGSEEILAGRAYRGSDTALRAELGPVTKGILLARQRTPVARRIMKLAIDDVSGFCIARCWTRTESSLAQGMRLGGGALDVPDVEDRRAEMDDMAGWTIDVPGGIVHAARAGERVYVAAGRSGLQVVDLDCERVVASLDLPGSTRHVSVFGSRAVVIAIHEGEPWEHTIGIPNLVLESSTPIERNPAARPKLGEGVLDRFERGERTYSLTRTELVERLNTADGQTTGRTPLNTTLGDGARIIDVDESGTAILSIPGRGVVVLYCRGLQGFQEEDRPCK